MVKNPAEIETSFGDWERTGGGMLTYFKRQLATRRSVFTELLSIGGEVATNQVIKHFKTLKPTVFQLNVNARCNARCQMCNIWQTVDKTELSLEHMDRIFSDPIFRSIEYIILAGGEPTLRKDLPEVVGLLLKHMPKLRKISIPTTGVSKVLSVQHFAPIAKACVERKVFLSIGISLDGVGEVYNRVRGLPDGFRKVLDTLAALKQLNNEVEFQLGIGATISALNVYDLYNIVRLSEEQELGLSFAVAAFSESYFNNLNLADNITLTREAKEFLRKFLQDRIAHGPVLSELPFYYEKALEMLDGAKRSIPCPYQDQGIVLDATGDLHYCTNSRTIGNVHQGSVSAFYYNKDNLAYRKRVTQEVCPGCSISCFVGVGLRKTMFPFLGFAAKQQVRRLKARLYPPANRGAHVVPIQPVQAIAPRCGPPAQSHSGPDRH
jgi:MoaA/NifB/PqqE/SkfB family radical SAM enzyme